MKILHVALLTPQPDARSGAGVVLHEQLQALRERHELTMVLLAPDSKQTRHAQLTLKDQGLEVHILRAGLPLPLVHLKRTMQGAVGRARGWPAMGVPGYTDPALIRLVNRLLDQRAFDLVQVENFGLGSLPFERTVPSLVVEHEVLDAGHPGARQQENIWYEAGLIQVFTQRDADAIARRVPDVQSRIRVNPFGVDLDTTLCTVRDEAEEKHAVTFIGNFNHLPNVDAAQWLCQEVMPGVWKMHPDAVVHLIGQDPPGSIKSLDGDRIRVYGRVESVFPHLARAAVAVVPVRKGGGMRVKTLQAMAAGRPVVTTRLGAEGLIGPEPEWPLVLADQAGDFAGSVCQLLDHPEDARQLGRRARAFVKNHHTWAAYISRLEAVYHELLTARHAGAT